MSRRCTTIAICIAACLAACASSSPPVDEVVDPRPTLRWTVFPTPADLAADEQGLLGGAEKIAYELVVHDAADGRVVYAKKGILGAEHRLEVSLPTGRDYRWTVRPHFEIRGRPRVGQWRVVDTSVHGRLELPLPMSALASFRT